MLEFRINTQRLKKQKTKKTIKTINYNSKYSFKAFSLLVNSQISVR